MVGHGLQLSAQAPCTKPSRRIRRRKKAELGRSRTWRTSKDSEDLSELVPKTRTTRYSTARNWILAIDTHAYDIMPYLTLMYTLGSLCTFFTTDLRTPEPLNPWGFLLCTIRHSLIAIARTRRAYIRESIHQKESLFVISRWKPMFFLIRYHLLGTFFRGRPCSPCDAKRARRKKNPKQNTPRSASHRVRGQIFHFV